MSISIKGTTITLTRGDTLKIKLDLTDGDGKPYTPNPNDSIRFAMKKKYTDSKPVVVKEIPNDTLVLHLEPEDTKNLQQPLDYVYDIQITTAAGDVDTFIANAILHLSEEVY